MRSSQVLLAQRTIHVLLERVCTSRIVATDDDCHVSDDMDTLTVMNEDIAMEASSSNDARYQRDVSLDPLSFQSRELTSQSNFCTYGTKCSKSILSFTNIHKRPYLLSSQYYIA